MNYHMKTWNGVYVSKTNIQTKESIGSLSIELMPCIHSPSPLSTLSRLTVELAYIISVLLDKLVAVPCFGSDSSPTSNESSQPALLEFASYWLSI